MGTTNLSGTPAFLGTSSIQYSAKDVRRYLTAAPILTALGGEGIVESGDFAVSQRAAGANMSVDVAAGEAYVKGDTNADEGSYYVRETGTINVLVDAADASNPRIDRVVLEIKNDSEDAGGLNLGRIRTIAGTPTVGATLTNLTGAAAVPNTCLLLANLVVAASDTSIVTADIQDRRFGVPIAGRELFNGVAELTSNTTTGTLATSAYSTAIGTPQTIIGNGINPITIEANLGGGTYCVDAAVHGAWGIWDGTIGSGTLVACGTQGYSATNAYEIVRLHRRMAAFSGAKTFSLAVQNTGGSSNRFVAVAASDRPLQMRSTWAG